MWWERAAETAEDHDGESELGVSSDEKGGKGRKAAYEMR